MRPLSTPTPTPAAAAAAAALALTLGAGSALAEIDVEAGKAHWAYRPLADPAVPAVADHAWPRGDLDRFLLSRMEAQGVPPVRDAGPLTLLRRATFDLTGLPPTPAEMATFLGDCEARGLDSAYQALVERLLASPAYGERWGRHWLDVVRYADTSGSSSDHPVPEAQRYRDYVIASFNADKPFDRFVVEQLAGDLLEHRDEDERRECITATGYLAGARRFGVSGKEMHLTIEDAITNLGEAFLATSVACARCHDHMHDPVPARDYYALYGIFSSTRFPFPGAENQKTPTDFVALDGDGERRAELERGLEEADDALDDLKRATRGRRETGGERDRRKGLERQIADAKKALGALGGELAYAVADAGETGDAPLHRLGDPGQRGDPVPRGFLSVLGGQRLPDGYGGSGRLELARWITGEDNPLFARVIANRIWTWHFGRGIVATPNDFGTFGAAPSHPELLDHLARRFIDSGYSFKAMHRAIMSSRAYRLSSDSLEANDEADPEAALRWRFERRRLSAEELRDAMLAASGQLLGGPAPPHPFPPASKWGYTQHAPFYASYDHDHRSVYLMRQRIRRHPVLAVFDGADPNASTPQRGETSSPVGALFLMNNRFAGRAADALAARLLAAADTVPEQVDLACRLLLSRPATEEDIKLAQSHLARVRDALAEAGTDDELEIEAAALASYAKVLFCTNAFAYVD